MSDDMFLCIFCNGSFFFKKDFKEHVIKHHQKPDQSGSGAKGLTEIVEYLSSYCSSLETTLSNNKNRRKRAKKYLPENNVSELLVGCDLCDQIIKHYKLETFDRTLKPSKDRCVCGDNEDNTYNLVTCTQCRHSYHYECLEADEFSSEDLSKYQCKHCKEMEFVINICNDLKPLDQLKHVRQHLNYSPFKCIYDSDCNQKFFTHPLFVSHLKSDHQMTEQSICKSKRQLFSYEKVIEIEEILEKKGIINEMINIKCIEFNGETARQDVKVESDTKPVISPTSPQTGHSNQLATTSVQKPVDKTPSASSDSAHCSKTISKIRSMKAKNLSYKSPLSTQCPKSTVLESNSELIEQLLKIETEEPEDKRCESYQNISKTCSIPVEDLIQKAKSTAIKSFLIKIEVNLSKIRTCINSFDKEVKDSKIALSDDQLVFQNFSKELKQQISEILDNQHQISLREEGEQNIKSKDEILNEIKTLIKKIDPYLRLSDKNAIYLENTSTNSNSDANLNDTESPANQLTANIQMQTNGMPSTQKTNSNDSQAKTSKESDREDGKTQKANLNNYTIPHIKLPETLTQDVITKINNFIERFQNESQLSAEQMNQFCKTLFAIEKDIRRLSNQQKDQIRNYMNANLKYLKNNLMERCKEFEEKLIETDITETLDALKNSINKSSPTVMKEFRERMKKIQTNKNHGIQPEMTIPLKEFPFNEEITKCLKDLTLFKVELYELLFGQSDFELMTLKDYIFEFIDSRVLRLWPNDWMKNDTLFRKVKSFIKQKTPKKVAKPVTELSKQPQASPNKTFTISSNQLKEALCAAKLSNSDTVQNCVKDKEKDCNIASTSKSGEPAAKRAKIDESLNNSKQIADQSQEDNEIEKQMTDAFSGDLDGSLNSLANKEEQSEMEKSRYNLRSKTDKSATIPTSSIPNVDEHLINDIKVLFKRWTLQTKVVKFPYFPQIDDQVVYIRSGHYHYVSKLKEKKLITSNRTNFKIRKYSVLENRENDLIFAFIREISFESKPFLSVKLRLEEQDPQTGEPLNEFFDIQYTYLEEVPDFLVLRTQYDKSLDYSFKAGSAVQSMIIDDDFWHSGTIVEESPFEEISHSFPGSPFKKFKVNFTFGNWVKRLSPWELYPIDANKYECESFPISDIERCNIYETVPEDWPHCHFENPSNELEPRDFESVNLSQAFLDIMVANEVVHFSLSDTLFNSSETKPIYEIDLSLIQQRLHSKYYRRLAQIKFDLDMIENNIEQYLKINDSVLVLNDFQKLKRVLFEYMDTNFWARNGKSIMPSFKREFPPLSQERDSDIEYIENEELIDSQSSQTLKESEKSINNCVDVETNTDIQVENHSPTKTLFASSSVESQTQTETSLNDSQTQTDSSQQSDDCCDICGNEISGLNQSQLFNHYRTHMVAASERVAAITQNLSQSLS